MRASSTWRIEQPVDLFELNRPDRVDDGAWEAIEAGVLRLKRACDVEDAVARMRAQGLRTSSCVTAWGRT